MLSLDAGIRFDTAYTSLLSRANQTCDIILNELGQTDIPVNYSWKLNERHYGELTGQSLVLNYSYRSIIQNYWKNPILKKMRHISKKNLYTQCVTHWYIYTLVIWNPFWRKEILLYSTVCHIFASVFSFWINLIDTDWLATIYKGLRWLAHGDLSKMEKRKQKCDMLYRYRRS